MSIVSASLPFLSLPFPFSPPFAFSLLLPLTSLFSLPAPPSRVLPLHPNSPFPFLFLSSPSFPLLPLIPHLFSPSPFASRSPTSSHLLPIPSSFSFLPFLSRPLPILSRSPSSSPFTPSLVQNCSSNALALTYSSPVKKFGSCALFFGFTPLNRPFPSSPQPPFQSEAKCEVFVMKISFHSY